MSGLGSASLLRRLAGIGFVAAVLVTALAFVPAHASAQSFDITGVTTIESQAAGWFATAQGWAQKTYLALLVIELTILGIQGVLFRDNLAEFFATFGFKIFVAGFFMWLIANADGFFHGIVNGLRDAGQQLGTDNSGLTTVVTMGLACAAMLFGAASAGHGTDNAISFIPNLYLGTGPTGLGNSASSGHAIFDLFMTGIGMMVVFSMAGIVIQFALITIESYIVLGAGVLFLGFSGSRFTMPFAQGYISYAVNVGVKLFTFYLMLGAVQALMPNALIFSGATLALAAIPYGYGSEAAILPAAIAAFSLMLVTTLLYAIPNFAGSFLSGSSSLSAGAMMGQFTNAMSGIGQARAGFAQMNRGADSQTALHDLQAHKSANGAQQPADMAGGGRRMDAAMPGAATPTVFGTGATGAADTSAAGADMGATGTPDDAGMHDQIGAKPSETFVAGGTGTPTGLTASAGAQNGIAAGPRSRPPRAVTAAAAAIVPPSAAAAPPPAAAAPPPAAAAMWSSASRPASSRSDSSSADADAGSSSTDPLPMMVPAGPGGTPIPVFQPSAAHDGSTPRAIGSEESIRHINRAELPQRLQATPWAQVSKENREQIYADPELAAIAERVYGEEYKRERPGIQFGGMYAASGLRSLMPPADAPVGGVQIRLSNPDKL